MAPSDDDFDTHSTQSTRDIALMALIKIQGHEKTCADRYGIIIKLGMGIIGGIGLQIIDKAAELFKIVPTH